MNFPDFPQALQTSTGILILLGHSSCHSTLCSVGTDNRVKKFGEFTFNSLLTLNNFGCFADYTDLSPNADNSVLPQIISAPLHKFQSYLKVISTPFDRL
jgi:hypothetical protein